MDKDSFDVEWANEIAKEEADRQRKLEPPPAMTPEEFLAWRSPRSVSKGPTRLDNPLWHWLVRTGWSGYRANETFAGPSSFDSVPVWCFERYGKSETALPDGRVVHIGGEHEDYYDPDFFIYNDVTVIGPDGSIEIRGYPREVFPPTDFHSATLVGNAIVIIGCLGYHEQRVAGETPVFRLDLDTFEITRVGARGEAPGWIQRHAAKLANDGRSVEVRGGEIWRSNDLPARASIDAWSLDLVNCCWKRLSTLDWPQWTMMRTDRKANRLWDTRQELWHRDNAWEGLQSYWNHDDAPDFAALEALYRLDETIPVPQNTSAHNVYEVVVDGVSVRFREEHFFVAVTVEGQLSEARLIALRETTLAMLSRLDRSEWHIVV
jgi:hypothetical protein